MQKAQCIIRQYGNYTIDDLGVSLNGINTQGENIADNGGIKEAYQAYSKYIVQRKKLNIFTTKFSDFIYKLYFIYLWNYFEYKRKIWSSKKKILIENSF